MSRPMLRTAVAFAVLAYAPSAFAWAVPANGIEPAPLYLSFFLSVACMAVFGAAVVWQSVQIARERKRGRQPASK